MRVLPKLFRPIDIAPLVFFRILGGSLMTITMTGELLTDFRLYYVQHSFHFSYLLFHWLGTWPPAMMYLNLVTNIVLGLLVTVGFHYRISALGLFLGSGCLFLMEKASYINHIYLYVLTAFVLIFLPAHRELSVDVRRNPSLRVATVPAWTVSLLVFQMSVVYLYSGIAKLSSDWLQALPLQVWLARKSHYPVIGPILGAEWTPYLLAYAGVGFDLLIVPAMLWSKTRKTAFAVAVVFHLTNLVVFHVGTFPLFSLVMTALYFPPDRFRKLPILKRHLGPVRESLGTFAGPGRRWVLGGLALYAAIKLLVPLRQFLYPGDSNWTEEGHRFAWHMMLRAKSATAFFTVRDVDTGRQWQERAVEHMPRRAYRDMVGKPDMILEFAHYLAGVARRNGHDNVEVRCRCMVSLNGRPRQFLVDPNRDLLAFERGMGHYDWVLPSGG